MSLPVTNAACLEGTTVPVVTVDAEPRFQPGRGPNGTVLNVGFQIAFMDKDGKQLSPLYGYKSPTQDVMATIAQAITTGAKTALEGCQAYKDFVKTAYGVQL